ncbi:MAG TPA: hypothetical protein VN961_23815 [Streptosporangiaceae bacterium]|nr:hypothetical protein [Streptosporangiaceae bacterium]
MSDEDARLRRRERDRARRANADEAFQSRLADEITQLFPDARPSALPRSPGTPARGAAGRSADPPPAARSTKTPSAGSGRLGAPPGHRL